MSTQFNSENLGNGMTISEFIAGLKEWYVFLRKKWLTFILIGLVGAACGLWYSLSSKVIYNATISFALEDEKSSGGSLSGALNLASQFGIDVGSNAGGAFSGSNLIEFMKSRFVIEKTLLTPVTINGRQQSVADYYIAYNELKEKAWKGKPLLQQLSFPYNIDRSKFTIRQDSILGVFYRSIVLSNFSVAPRDKKLSIIDLSVRSVDEQFSKSFAEVLIKNVTDFYVETKTKKTAANVRILQMQVDSVRRELNGSINDVASAVDNTFNLNPSLNIRRTPSQKKQIDVQANTVILTELVKNLELAKVTLMKETPLLQIIDRPILPLQQDRVGKLKAMVVGSIIAGFLTFVVLVIRRILSML